MGSGSVADAEWEAANLNAFRNRNGRFDLGDARAYLRGSAGA